MARSARPGVARRAGGRQAQRLKEGGEVVTLSKRLGHATPQVTMTVYADEIEEANDGAARRAQANQLFAGTKLAAFLAASETGHGGDAWQQAA